MSRPVVPRCLLCGALHAACGPRGTTAPLDVFTAPRRETDMSELRLYTVVVGGNETTMMLNDTDAERLGAKLVADKPAAAETHRTAVPIRSREPADKARRPDRAG